MLTDVPVVTGAASTNVMDAVWVMGTESPIALTVGTPAVADVTENVTTPNELDVELVVEIVSTVDPELRSEASETVLFGTTLSFTSLSVTVTVLVARRASDVGEATTVE